jgi:uncharacterized protein (DUF885 family)
MVPFNRIFIALVVFIMACSPSPKREASQTSEWQQRLLEAFWERYPEWASTVGYHKADSSLVVYSEESREAEHRFIKLWLDTLQSLDTADWTVAERIDRRMALLQLQAAQFYLTKLKAWEWNPAHYNLAATVAEIAAGTWQTPEERLRSIEKRLSKAPDYFLAARNNLKDPVPEYLELGIEQNQASLETLNQDIPNAIKASNLDASVKARMLERCNLAAVEQTNYVAFLKQFRGKKGRSFRLGKSDYQQKFMLEMAIGYTPDDLLAAANERKKQTLDSMAVISKRLFPKYFPKKIPPLEKGELTRLVLTEISKKHCSPDSFQSSISAQIPVLENFVKEKKLVGIDPKKPLVVRKEPAYMQGVAGASISAPGPYDAYGNTYYNVGSLAGYSAEEAESYLREYNHYTLQILNIHEAIPGHYTQLVYANKTSSIIKAIFGNNPMIEGWAVFGERLMMNSGYPSLDGTPSSDEMWLMYYKWHLRSVCNTILDIGIHCHNLSQKDALSLLMRDAFQEKTEAENKWRRATVSSVQLCCYFGGYHAIDLLKREFEKREGANFNLRNWNERFLSFGSAPIPCIGEAMRGDKKN